MNIKIRPGRRAAALAGFAILTGTLTFLTGGSASARVAPGCTADRPTFVGGTIQGYTDLRALDIHLGVWVGTTDAAGHYLQTLYPDGTPTGPDAAYSWIEKLNSTFPATGVDLATDPSGDITWGQCVTGNVTRFDVETYPKDPIDPLNPDAPQVTDKVRYASTAYYNGVVTNGQALNLALRIPVVFQAGGGNTGGVNGYLTYNGVAVPAADITRIRVFPGPGTACGIRGYSAAPDELVTNTGPDRTYYRVDYLVGEQCGATYQSYALQMTCHAVCGATDKAVTKAIAVSKGLVPRVDVSFG